MATDNATTTAGEDHNDLGVVDVQRVFAEVLAELVGVDQVSAQSDFFAELGADSMLMARFCARVRKRPGLPAVSMKDIYRYPTLSSLATALTTPTPTTLQSSPPVPRAPAAQLDPAGRIGTFRYLVCGALQLALFGAAAYLFGLIAVLGYQFMAGGTLATPGAAVSIGTGWRVVSPSILAGTGWLAVYLRSVLFGCAVFLLLCVLPVAAKWLLVGRWTSRRIRVWSLGYARFWLVKTLIRTSPMVLFAGSPLYLLYLRALGAKIGSGVVIFSRHVPVCTDLLTVGAGSLIREEVFFNCYRARAGWIETGPVTLGKQVIINESTVVDIATAMGDRAQLGHASSLHSGQTVPDHQRWHGSPGQPTHTDYATDMPMHSVALRRISYSLLQLVRVTAFGPAILAALVLVIKALLGPGFTALQPGLLSVTNAGFYPQILAVALVGFCGSLLVGLLVVLTVPRALNRFLAPGQVYPLYGIRFWLHRVIGRMTNLTVFTYLFGDSSYIVNYLRWLGYDLSEVIQTGSNFGLDVRHDTPYLSAVGSGTMVADGLSIINTDYSTTSFRMSPVAIGARNFLGNYVAYPPQGRTGDNCLLATKVMVPTDGPIRENVGLLGSPCFEIPRSVERDSSFDHLRTGETLRQRLRAKNRHNRATMALYLLVRLVHTGALAMIAALTATLYHSYGAPAGATLLALAAASALLFSAIYFILVERLAVRFRALRPLFCSIYDPAFWRHERYWKLSAVNYLTVFNGTPFKNLIWRLLGVRIGHRVFDDGCVIPEKSLVTLGSDSVLNEHSRIWCHSQEDGTFKSDHIVIETGATLGVGTLVHYGTHLGAGAVLDPDTFLMKGEEVPAGARWGGNPARTTDTPQPRTHPHLSPDHPRPPVPDTTSDDRATGPTSRRHIGGLVVVGLLAALAGGAAVFAFDHTAHRPAAATDKPTAPGGTPASDPSAAGGSVAAVRTALPSVVELAGPGGVGSGVVLTADGMILTNAHLLSLAAGGDLTATFSNATSAPVTVIGTDTSDDLAVVQAQGTPALTPIQPGDSEQLQLGQPVLAIGSPFGLTRTVTSGIISALDRPVLTAAARPDAAAVNAIQTDAPIQPGNSGGPLIDVHGRVVGITSTTALPAQPQSRAATRHDIGFATPINRATRIARQLIAAGHATRATLGAITTRDTTPTGATLITVPPNSPAAQAGLHPGDVITTIDDHPITNSLQLTAALNGATPDSTVTITLANPTSHTLTATLGSIPAP